MNTPDYSANPPGVTLPGRTIDAIWFNALWFQGVWFCAVIGREQLLPLAVALLALHLALASHRWQELRQMVCVGGLGIAVDAALSFTGVYQFAGGVLVPLWLCCLWFAFGAVLGRSLAYLADRPFWSAVAGAVVFPLNYWAGQRLGGVSFGYPLPQTLALLALTWSLMLPLLYKLTGVLAASRAKGSL